MTEDGPGCSRRGLLASSALAGLTGLAGCPAGDDSGDSATATDGGTDRATGDGPEGPRPADAPQAAVRGSHAPGPPVFTSVGEAIRAPEFAGVESDLAPWNPTTDGTFAWRVADAPADSEATAGDAPVVQFEPDVPGTYTLELDAPDGTHPLTVRAFPARTAGDPRPTLTLSGRVADDAFVVEADTRSPDDTEPTVEFLVDDRDRDAVSESPTVDGPTARLPTDAVDDTVRIHAAAVTDTGRSVADTLHLHPDGSVQHPTEPPAWAEDCVVYEIFVRRFGPEVDFAFLESKVDYLDEMGADAVWLTPILDAHSHRDESQPGGPHGYDVIDYFEPADALGDRAAFEAFVDTCHERDIRVIFDLVVNHTAREHRYFQSAAGGEDAPFRDWYLWDGDTAQYYFGWRGIPLLNYDTPAVRAWALAVAAEWADVVDGFRCDVAWGVPHSFWKEFRSRIKRDHPDFLLLAEAVPWDDDHADFAANEFGMHYAEGLFETLGDIATGDPADALHGVMPARRDEGYPDHVAMLNYVENHDTDRYLAVGDRASQPAAGAATFTLPGSPMLYYGQETGLTDAREPMNWADPDAELRAFYRDLTALRHDEPALRSAADVVPLSVAPGNDRVTGYARELDGRRVHVLLNFGDEPAAVATDPEVGSTDRISGRDVAVDGGVRVRDAVVVDAHALAGQGERLGTFADPAGDATPAAGTPEAAVDLRRVDVYDRDGALQVGWTVADLGGFEAQTFGAALRDPERTDGATAAPAGVDATLSAPCQYRVVVTPERAVLERADGEVVAGLDVTTVGDEIRVTLPDLGLARERLELAAFVATYDADAPGGVAQTGGTNLADAVVGPLDDEDDALASGTLPTVPLSAGRAALDLDATLLAAWTDPTGDDHGPGSYTYPESDRWPPGTFDLRRFAVYESPDRYHVQFRFAAPVERGRTGFRQHCQVYLRNPEQSGGTTAAREGVVADLAAPYQRRLVAGGSTAAVERADGTVVTEAVTVETHDGLPGLWVSVPKAAVGDLSEQELVPLVLGNSVTGEGGVAQVQAERSTTEFGGRDSETQPNVLDLVTPEGVTQAEALAADDGRAEIPFLRFERGR